MTIRFNNFAQFLQNSLDFLRLCYYFHSSKEENFEKLQHFIN